MFPKDVDPHNCLVEVGIGGLYQLIVYMFLIFQCIETFEDKFEHRFQVLWARCCHEYVGIAENLKSHEYYMISCDSVK